jgi:GNAT superfamily N-acetyltransferase
MKLLADPLQDSARALVERVHGRERLVSELPSVFDPRFTGRILALHEGDEARSACAILTREFVADGARVRGGLIGCVTTDPGWSRRGLATRLLEEAEAELARAGSAFALLWATEPAFYLRRGYGPVGREQDFLLTAEASAGLPRAASARAMRAADASAIHALYTAHPARLERSAEETEALLRSPGMSTLVLERAGDVVAYACLGRGADLGDTIHEWGGATEDALALFRAHVEARRAAGASEELFVMAPPTGNALGERLRELGAVAYMGVLGLGKILDRSAAAAALAERLAPLGTVELRAGARPFHLRGPASEASLDDEGCLALLLGAEGVRAEVASFLESLGLGGARLPMDVYAWGLDSI